MEPFYDLPYYEPFNMAYMPYPQYPQPPLSPLSKIIYQLKNANLSTTIKTAQKTIYTINQVVPLINQVRPLYHNAQTAFRVMHALKSMDDFNVDEEIDRWVDPDAIQQENHDDEPIHFENML